MPVVSQRDGTKGVLSSHAMRQTRKRFKVARFPSEEDVATIFKKVKNHLAPQVYLAKIQKFHESDNRECLKARITTFSCWNPSTLIK